MGIRLWDKANSSRSCRSDFWTRDPWLKNSYNVIFKDVNIRF